MKRIMFAVLAALMLAGGFTDAKAQSRVEKPLRWLSPDGAVPDGQFATKEGTQPLASAVLDTTGVFNMMDADIFGARVGHSTVNFISQDSVLVGYLVCYSDSSADVTNTLTAVTATIDASADGWDWAVAGTAAGIAASDDPIVAIPLYIRPGLDHQNLLTNAPKLRVRFTTVTGIMTAARVKLVYWANSRIQ